MSCGAYFIYHTEEGDFKMLLANNNFYLYNVSNIKELLRIMGKSCTLTSLDEILSNSFTVYVP